jgi:hypothetical protein
MGGGRYSTNNRVNAAAARAAAARASTPVISDPVVNLPVRSAVRPVQEEVVSLASPFDFSGLDFSNLDFSGLDLPDISPTASYTPPVAAPVAPVRQAKFYSDMTMAERREVDAIEAGEAPSLNLNTYQGIPDLDFGVGTQYDSPEQALSNYGNYFTNIQGQRESAAKVVNYNQFDPSDFAREGTGGSPQAVIGVASGESLSNYITKNDIPLTKEVDGKTMYLTTGDDNASFKLMPDKFKGGELVAQGPVGTYSSVFVKDDNLVESFLKEPIINVAASFIPGGTLAMTAAKAASGVDVTPVEIATSMLTGLEMAGVLKKPVVFDNGEYGGALGGVDPFTTGDLGTAVTDVGTGLFGSTYGQTKAALTAAAAGDAKGAAVALVGAPLLKEGLGKVGLDKEAIENAGIQYDDFEAGLNKVVSEVVGGTELDEALLAGVGKYITEGGTLGSIDLPETNIDLGIIEDVVRDVVRPIGTVATEVAKFVEESLEVSEGTKETLRQIDRQALQPIKEAAQSVTEPVYKAAKETAPVVEDVVRATGSAVDDAIIQPIREAGKVIDDEITQPIGDAFSALDTAVRNALPDIDWPSFDLGFPQLNINLPEGGLLTSQPSPTRTTDNLFKDELFKFKTEVGLEIEPLEYVDLDAPAENFFEDTYYEDPILGRSYNF